MSLESNYGTIIRSLCNDIERLQEQVDALRDQRDFSEWQCDQLREMVISLKPKRGRPAKKRVGRPKKVST
jgi:hypothetical protein